MGAEAVRLAREIPVGAAARAILESLSGAGHEALLAGGCVRDALRGATPYDYDVVTDATPEEICRLFPRTVPVGAQFGVVRVLEGDDLVEVATFRRDVGYSDGRRPDGVAFSSPAEDAARRDFTVNGLFYDVAAGQVIDYVNGLEDLERRLLRFIGDPEERIREDHLRAVRGARFAASLGFEVDPATAEAIRRLAPLAADVAAERFREELRRMLTGPAPGASVRMMDRLGILDLVLPEVARMKGVAQPPQFHPEGDVLEHTILALDQLDRPSWPLALAALFHDVGKPDTYEMADRIRFNRHESVGAEMVDGICRRLRTSAAVRARVVKLVKEHLLFKDARKMRQSRLRRLLADEAFDELAELVRADTMACHGDLTDHAFCMGERDRLSEEELRPEPLLRGTDLIEMGLEPGPVFSRLLAAVADAQLEGTVTTGDEARALVGRLLEERETIPGGDDDVERER